MASGYVHVPPADPGDPSPQPPSPPCLARWNTPSISRGNSLYTSVRAPASSSNRSASGNRRALNSSALTWQANQMVLRADGATTTAVR